MTSDIGWHEQLALDVQFGYLGGDVVAPRQHHPQELDLHVFVKKDDAEGKDFYYLGSPTAYDAEDTTMVGSNGVALPVVRMRLRFDEPIDSALYDYFHPTVTA